jgi:hypothetical protein
MMNVGTMRAPLKEMLITWSLRAGFALVGVLAVYLLVRGS